MVAFTRRVLCFVKNFWRYNIKILERGGWTSAQLESSSVSLRAFPNFQDFRCKRQSKRANWWSRKRPQQRIMGQRPAKSRNRIPPDIRPLRVNMTCVVSCVLGSSFASSQLRLSSEPQKNPLTFHYTGFSIVILTMVSLL